MKFISWKITSSVSFCEFFLDFLKFSRPWFELSKNRYKGFAFGPLFLRRLFAVFRLVDRCWSLFGVIWLFSQRLVKFSGGNSMARLVLTCKSSSLVKRGVFGMFSSFHLVISTHFFLWLSLIHWTSIQVVVLMWVFDFFSLFLLHFCVLCFVTVVRWSYCYCYLEGFGCIEEKKSKDDEMEKLKKIIFTGDFLTLLIRLVFDS